MLEIYCNQIELGKEYVVIKKSTMAISYTGIINKVIGQSPDYLFVFKDGTEINFIVGLDKIYEYDPPSHHHRKYFLEFFLSQNHCNVSG